ncbi:MAG: SapC family protein [Magnetococcales bacterium]|nr:SapC family protein [Magnetococcales bacterium]MBF0632257.1 SapC family protein [Magnetococcales bacterium]
MKFPVLYKRPIPLNKKVFSAIGIKTWMDGLSFAAGTHQVPALGPEFAEGCLHYPIVFARDSTGVVVPLFLLGYREGENLYLDKNGKWLAPYVPAYVRCYPFILAEGNEGTNETQVWVDQEGFVQDEDGERLFDESDENSPYLDKVLNLLRDSMTAQKLSLAFGAKLQELGLLVEQVANITLNDGSQYTVQGLLMVDEAKLNQLEDAVILELFHSGHLGWIHCHLLSQANLQGLLGLQ